MRHREKTKGRQKQGVTTKGHFAKHTIAHVAGLAAISHLAHVLTDRRLV